MAKKNGVSKKTLSVIQYVWFFFSAFLTLIIKETYYLNFWMYLYIGVPILIIGQTLIRKFIKVNE